MKVFDLTSQYKRDRLSKAVALATEKGWTVRFEKVRTPRSSNQNAFYWALLTMFGIEIGNTPEEMHADMKRAYKLYYTKNGKTYARSTSDLDSKQMTDYIEFIRNLMAEHGIEHHRTDAEYMRSHWAEMQDEFSEYNQHIGDRHEP